MTAAKPQADPPGGAGSPPSLGYIARATMVIVGIFAIAAAMWLARDFVFVLFLAILLSAFLSIFVDPLQNLGVPRPLAAPLILLAFLGVFVALVWIAWPLLWEQLLEMRQQLPRAIDSAVAWADDQYTRITGELGDRPRALQADITARVGNLAMQLAQGVLPVVSTIGGVMMALLVIVFAGLYLTIEQRLFLNNFIRLVPPVGRARATTTLEQVGHTLRRWMLGTVIAMLSVGTLSGVMLWILGIPTAFALAIIAALFEFIPIFGPIAASIPAIAIALVISPSLALWVALLYVAIQQLESNVITPLAMKGAVKLPPALCIGFQILMAVLFGFIGLLVAVPVLACLIVVVRQLYIEPMEQHAEASA